MRRAALLISGLLLAAPARAEDQRATPFTSAQADQGAEVYRDHCAVCHGANLDDAEFAPTLNGARFKRRWGGQSAAGLFAYMRSAMPPGQTGVLAPDDYAAVMAFLIRANGGTPGPETLPSDPEALGSLMLPK